MGGGGGGLYYRISLLDVIWKPITYTINSQMVRWIILHDNLYELQEGQFTRKVITEANLEQNLVENKSKPLFHIL